MTRSFWFVFVLLMLARHAEAKPITANFYVAKNGKDAWSGRFNAPNKAGTDGPFATLNRAVQAARAVNRNRDNFTGVNIVLRGGVYPLSDTVTLTGKQDSLLSLRSFPGEGAVLRGSQPIEGWTPVTEEAVLSRMDPACRGKVMKADLKANGIGETGAIVPNGWDHGGVIPGPSQLYFEGNAMTLARWPNTGYARIGEVPKESARTQFQYEGDHPSRWKNVEGGWLFGYWQFDWADSYVALKSVDPARHTLETEPISDGSGRKTGQRWFALNLLEELDSPGEYYLDRKTETLYFWPPVAIQKGQTFLSLLDKPLIALNQTMDVSLVNLTFEQTRGEGVKIEGGERNLVAGCAFQNLGLAGVRVAGGKNHRVQSCNLSHLGQGGIVLDGGDRKTLGAGNSTAENNLIHDYSEWVRCYRPAIGVNGVGQKVVNNLIYNGPHTAILLSGNNHIVNRNEIHHVCTDTGDVGAFYMGRDWTMRGNEIGFNFFHHLGGFKGEGFTDAMGVYLDDAASGTSVVGNVFYKAGRAAMIGGGRDNHITRNIFLECSPSVHVDARGTSWAKDYIKKGGEWQMYEKLASVEFDKPPYSVHYPELAPLLGQEPTLPHGTQVTENIALGGTWTELQDGLTEAVLGFKNNRVEPKNPFAGLSDRELLARALKDLPRSGLTASQIGLKLDAYRKVLPSGAK